MPQLTALVLPEPMPLYYKLVSMISMSYQINAYVKEPNKQAVIYSNLHQNIQDVCNERGIEIMSPHYRAARDGNKTDS
jgi:small-conductance mechanosensitive channel